MPSSSSTKVPIRLDQGGSVLLSLCELTPQERWQHYGVLPIKVVLHLTLLLLTTWVILHDAARWGPYRLASQANVCHFFAPPSCAANLCGATPDLGYGWDNWSNCFVYSTEELRSAVHGVIHNYYHIQDIALANYGWMMTTTTEAGEATAGTAVKVRSNTTTATTISSSSSNLVQQPPILTATLQTAEKDLADRHTISYPLTLENLGPLDARIHSQAEIDDFLSRLVAMQINLELTDDLADDDANVCYLWGLQVLYDVQNKAEIAVSQRSYIKGFCEELDNGRKGGGGVGVDENGYWLHRGRRVRRRHDKTQQQQQRRGLEQTVPTASSRSSSSSSNSTIVSSPPIVGRVYVDPLAVFLSGAIFLVSLWLCLFLLSELHGSLFLLQRAHTLLDNKSKPQPSSTLYRRCSSSSSSSSFKSNAIDWATDVHLGTKFHFFSFWQVLLLSGALLFITESLHALHGLNAQAPPMVTDAHAAWRGLGVACLWVYTCRYLHHSDRLYAIVLVINHSVPRVARMLIQVVPLFVGFTWFGVMIFGPYLPRFGSFPQAFATLFCVWNGDALMDVHAELGVWFPGVGFVYLAVFVGVFSYVILNILLVVVQQTLVYVQVHDRGKRRLHRLLVGREGGREEEEQEEEEGGGRRRRRGGEEEEEEEGKEVVDVEKDFLALLDLSRGRDETGDFFDEAGVGAAGAAAAGGGEGGRRRRESAQAVAEETRRQQQQGLRQRRGAGEGEKGTFVSSMAAAAAKGSR